jgi:hypothetical protein
VRSILLVAAAVVAMLLMLAQDQETLKVRRDGAAICAIRPTFSARGSVAFQG